MEDGPKRSEIASYDTDQVIKLFNKLGLSERESKKLVNQHKLDGPSLVCAFLFLIVHCPHLTLDRRRISALPLIRPLHEPPRPLLRFDPLAIPLTCAPSCPVSLFLGLNLSAG